jgi:hypothetical protein
MFRPLVCAGDVLTERGWCAGQFDLHRASKLSDYADCGEALPIAKLARRGALWLR